MTRPQEQLAPSVPFLRKALEEKARGNKTGNTPPHTHSPVWCVWQRALSIHIHFCGPFCTAEARKLNTTLPGLPSNWVLSVNQVPPTRYTQGRLGYGSGGHPSAAWVLSVSQHGMRNCGFFTSVQCPAVICFTGMKRPSLQHVLILHYSYSRRFLQGAVPVTPPDSFPSQRGRGRITLDRSGRLCGSGHPWRPSLKPPPLGLPVIWMAPNFYFKFLSV